MTLRCYCCGEAYERGRFQCCAPPLNMSSQSWLDKHCKVCVLNNDLKLRSHCPRHCTCPKASVHSAVPGFAAFMDSKLLDEIDKRNRLKLVSSR